MKATDRHNAGSTPVTTRSEREPEPILDQASASILYKGWAPLGTLTSDDNWKITKAVTAGTVTTTYYADGDMNYDNVWDDRATLKYTR